MFGQRAREQPRPGVVGEPKECAVAVREVEKINVQDFDTFKPSSKNEYNPDRFAARLEKVSLSYGFSLDDTSSQAIAISASFG